MTPMSSPRASTRVSRIIKAPRLAVYRACIDPQALAAWRAPDGMTAPAHSPGGKTDAVTDAFQGQFVELVPGRRIVELVTFDSPDPQFAGAMRITTCLEDAGEGTEVAVLCEDIPPGVRPEDNETGTRQSLQKLAALLE
jgi:uncharacterized protein YndB with AHSA1/START domain